MALDYNTATNWAARAQAWEGAEKRDGLSRKYALTATSATIILPLDTKGQKPALMRFSLPAGAKVYADFAGDVAVVPTTSVDGSIEIRDGDVASPWGADRVALVAEANGTITISYMWA